MEDSVPKATAKNNGHLGGEQFERRLVAPLYKKKGMAKVSKREIKERDN